MVDGRFAIGACPPRARACTCSRPTSCLCALRDGPRCACGLPAVNRPLESARVRDPVCSLQSALPARGTVDGTVDGEFGKVRPFDACWFRRTTVLHALSRLFTTSFFLSNVYLRWDYMFLNYTLNTVRTGCPEGHANGNRYEYRVPRGAR